MLETGDFVINLESIEKDGEPIIVENSVGLVRETNGDLITVFFIGTKKQISLNESKLKKLDLSHIGDNYEYKICNVCHILKTIVNFQKNQNGINNRPVRRPSCNDCRKIIDGVHLCKNEKGRMEGVKPKNLFCCPICGKYSIPGVTANIVIDHDHKNGTARQWICDSCNTGLGRFKDDVKILAKAIEYLEKYEK